MSAHSTVELLASEPSFPIEVRAMQKPPSRLYVRGVLPGPGRSVAIVGTRYPTAEAARFAYDLAYRVSCLGWSVWSGGAAGIDAAAHQGALAARGNTVVVMGTGFNKPYPTENKDLFQHVLDAGGAWLSLYPPEQLGARWTFLPRNELLAAMVEHIVMVQAPIRSGARSTMAAGRRMAKRLWAVASCPWHSVGAGCLQELRDGATMLVSADQLTTKHAAASFHRGAKFDALHQLAPDFDTTYETHSLIAKPSKSIPTNLNPCENAIIQILQKGNTNIDSLCDQTNLSASLISRTILTLSLQGIVTEHADGTFGLV